MWNIKKYAAMASVGVGLAFASTPASACGGYGYGGYGLANYGYGGCGYGLATYGGCGAYGYRPTYGYGGCGAYGMYRPHRAYAYYPGYRYYRPAYAYAGCGY
jgi:hypothetical protein